MGERTRPSLIAGLSEPRMSFCAAEVNSARPAMGRYSWFRLGSFRRISSAFLTTGNTHGFALLSRYAPMPKSTFFSFVSLRYAAISPNNGSSGAWGTTLSLNRVSASKPPAEPMVCCLTWERRELALVWDGEEDEVEGLGGEGMSLRTRKKWRGPM